MIRWVCCLFILLGAYPLLAEDYAIFEDKGKYGLKDEQGRVVINPAFEGLGWSNGNFSVIGQVTGYKLDNRWGLINLKEQKLTPAEYLMLEPSGGDRFIVKKQINAISSKVGCINLKGDVVVPLQYDGISVSGLRAIVFVKNDKEYKYGVVNLNGDIIIPLRHKNIFSIGNMRYAVQNFDNKSALFSEAGDQLTPFDIDSLSTFKKNKAIVYEGNYQGIINREGVIEVKPQYREVKIDDNGTAKARGLNKWIILNVENQTIRETWCDEMIPVTNGFKVRTGNDFGIWDEEFSPVIPFSYDDILQVSNERAVVMNGTRYGLIERNNSMVIPFLYDSMILGDKFVRVREKLLGKDSWSLFDVFGIRKSERTYEFMYPFNGKFFLVKNYGLYGIVDRYGKEVVHCVYDSILDFKEDQIVVKFHGHYGIIDFRENWLLPPQPYPVQLVDDEHYLLTQETNCLFKSFDDELIYFTDNTLTIEGAMLKETLADGTIKKISFSGITVSRSAPAILENTEIVSTEHENLRAIKRNGKYGFIDNEGKLRIANRYEGVGDFHDGLAAVKILGKWGFVNTQDKIVVNPSYEWVSEFESDVAIVKRGKFGLVNGEGQSVLETRYDNIKRLESGKFLLFNNGLVGLASEKGDVLVEPRFNRFEYLDNGHAIISIDNKFGLITENGFSVIPMIYDHLMYLEDAQQYLVKQEAPWVTLP